MRSVKVEFENQSGQQLAGRLELPVDGKPFTYALFAHCFTCNKNLTAVRNISRALTLEGIGVLRFDFTGLGESEGDFGDTNFSSQVGDLLAAVDFMDKEHGKVRLMIGHSLGGAATLMAAAKLPEVKAVATIGAPADPEHVRHLFSESLDEIREQGYATVKIGGRPFTIRKQFVDDIENNALGDAISGLRKALLVMHAPFDEIVGVDNAAKIYKAAIHPKSFISLHDADHLLSDKADSLYAGNVIAAWLRKYIDFPEPPELHSEKRVVVRTDPSGFFTEIRAGNHHLVADEPEKVGGTDLGPTPYDLLIAALGACTSMTLKMYADRKEIALENVLVHLTHDKVHAEDCESCAEDAAKGKVDQVRREIELVGDLTEKQRERMLQIANMCPVHKTLHSHIDVVSTLKPVS